MAGALETAQPFASQVAQMTGTAETTQRFATQAMQTIGAAALVERYVTSLAQMTAAPLADLNWVVKMPAAALRQRQPSAARGGDDCGGDH